MVKKRRLSEANLPAKKRALIRRDSDEVPNEDVKQKLGNEGNDSTGDNKTAAQGRALVSRRVSVLWDDDGKWYSGIIADYRTIRGRSEHQIVYDVDGGAVMRTVDQAQKLLAGGTTTHEWLVFEASPNSKDPKLNWRFIQGEPISDNSSSLELSLIHI